MPRPCAHSSRAGNSSSFTPLSATALILTLRPAACAASMPARTLSSSPQRVMARNLSGSSVSSETLMRRTPWPASSAAYFGSCEPLVVSVSSSSAPVARWRDSEANSVMMPRRTSGSPPVSRSLRTPARDEGAAQAVELFEREQVGLGQERHVLRHAIDAAEIAAVGHRDAQIGDRAPERIDEGRGRSHARDDRMREFARRTSSHWVRYSLQPSSRRTAHHARQRRGRQTAGAAFSATLIWEF